MSRNRFRGRQPALVLLPGFSGICFILLSLGCLSLVSGCESGLGGKDSSSFENPFKKLKNPLSAVTGKSKKEDLEKRKLAAKYNSQLATAHSLEQSKKHVEARAVYERLITSQPDRFEAYHKLGVLADIQRRYPEAQSLYTEAILLNPRNPNMFNDLGYCLFLQGKLDKAEAALLKAVAMSPSKARFRNNLGMVLGHQGRYKEAMEQFRRSGSEADAYFNMAFILVSREDVDGAKDCFRLALAVDPTYEKARRALQSFETYDEGPAPDLHDTPLVDDGIHWVPAEGAASEVQAASHTSEAASGSLGADTSSRPDTQSLLKRARTLMSGRMAENVVTPQSQPSQ